MVRLLGVGREHIKSSYEIARALGVSQRAVGFEVQSLRDDGWLIGSVHGGGYYLLASEEEYQATRAHLLARIEGGLARLDRMDAAWSVWREHLGENV